jgi:hypothetical protein
MHEGLSVTPLMTFPCQQGYTGLFLETLKFKLGSLVAPSGRHTQSKEETLALLLVTHFPNTVVTVEVAPPAVACCVKCLD